MMILDAHCDAPSQMLRGRDFGLDNGFAQVDFPKMKRGSVYGSFFAMYVPAGLSPDESTAYACKMMEEVKRQVAENKDTVAFAPSSARIRENREQGLVSIVLAIENGSAMFGHLPGQDTTVPESWRSNLKYFSDNGIRYITLTHNSDNEICSSCNGAGPDRGLTALGREVVEEMNSLGVIVDLAHSSYRTMKDVLDVSSSPVAYTHGCCMALSSHRRNILDDVIRGIADKGGVCCMSIYPQFLSDSFALWFERSGLESKMSVEDRFISDPSNPEYRRDWEMVQKELQALDRPSVEIVADHICHAVNTGGIEAVGIGTDYDGIALTASGLEDVSCLYKVLDALHKRHFSDDQIEKIASGNLLRLF